MLKALSRGIMDGFGVTAVLAFKYSKAMDVWEEIEALLWVIGSCVMDVAKKRRESLYGDVGSESGDQYLTPKEEDAAEAVKEKFKTTLTTDQSGRAREYEDNCFMPRPPKRTPMFSPYPAFGNAQQFFRRNLVFSTPCGGGNWNASGDNQLGSYQRSRSIGRRFPSRQPPAPTAASARTV
jgi:hypothetical protein